MKEEKLQQEGGRGSFLDSVLNYVNVPSILPSSPLSRQCKFRNSARANDGSETKPYVSSLQKLHTPVNRLLRNPKISS